MFFYINVNADHESEVFYLFYENFYTQYLISLCLGLWVSPRDIYIETANRLYIIYYALKHAICQNGTRISSFSEKYKLSEYVIRLQMGQ